jgi:hypothetical protein
MIEVRSRNINELELLQVIDYLEKRGTKYAQVYEGNGCVWVSSGSSSVPINEYFIFRDGRIADIQID